MNTEIIFSIALVILFKFGALVLGIIIGYGISEWRHSKNEKR